VTDRPRQPPGLLSLLDHLATVAFPSSGSPLPTGEGQGEGRSPVHWNDWRIERINGGRNNLLFHVLGEHGDFAVKFTMRDDRDRAGGEYRALLALSRAGLDLAPLPIFLDPDRYQQPVVVQTWLTGDLVGVAPTSEADWHALIGHYAKFHSITPGLTDIALTAATLTMDSAASGRARITKELLPIPRADQPANLLRLIDALQQIAFPAWPSPPVTLCRSDPNPQNFLRRPVGWASVDWEYSGWGDPAFELADLLSHPAYLGVSPSRLDALVDAYDPRSTDRTFGTRVQTYYRLMLVWWSARFARLLYEGSRGLDRRLATRPAGWQAEAEANYAAYLRLATTALA
jgi:aminoglycoside phosphotransferase (APT) family kinase protein